MSLSSSTTPRSECWLEIPNTHDLLFIFPHFLSFPSHKVVSRAQKRSMLFSDQVFFEAIAYVIEENRRLFQLWKGLFDLSMSKSLSPGFDIKIVSMPFDTNMIKVCEFFSCEQAINKPWAYSPKTPNPRSQEPFGITITPHLISPFQFSWQLVT